MSVERNKEEQVLDSLLGKKGKSLAPKGFSVPEGFFDKIADEVVSKLPEQEPVQRHVEMTRWQKIKPYVYLAAMFCGIWLMMNVFHRVSSGNDVNLDNPPAHIAQILHQSEPQETYMYVPSLMGELELEDDMSDAYDNMKDFVADFNAADVEVTNDSRDNL